MPKLLIADDDAGFRRLLRTTLEPLGADIHDAWDAFGALLNIRQGTPDLAILDVNMPAGNGLSVCEMLLSDEAIPHFPILILTGDATHEIKCRCQTLGVTLILKGPDAVDQIKAVALEVLGGVRPEIVDSQLYIG